MFHVYWPALASLAVIVMMVIMAILMYGDKICARVRTEISTRIVERGRNYRERTMEMERQKSGFSYGQEIEKSSYEIAQPVMSTSQDIIISHQEVIATAVTPTIDEPPRRFHDRSIDEPPRRFPDRSIDEPPRRFPDSSIDEPPRRFNDRPSMPSYSRDTSV